MLSEGTPAICPRHGHDLPPPRAAAPPAHCPGESRPCTTEWWGRGGADHHDLTPDYLRPPSPEKNAPRASAVGDS